MKIKAKTLKISKGLKALSDPSRLSVVLLLFEKEKFVGEMNKVLKIEPTLLSHHLSILRETGFIQSRRQGKKVLYKLNPVVRLAGKNRGLKFGPCKVVFTD
jgi:ArsR family transcriptional regulator